MNSNPENYMLRCLELAQLGIGPAAPNPSVGCVIVHKGRIIGEGYTSAYGGDHAEVNAINSVQEASLLPHSTLYVSLEPCAHFGKTPPCANLIIEKKIKRVVIACLDPFAAVNGLGIKRLIEAGVDVKVGLLEAEAQEMNRRFFTFHQKKRPYIILKWAETADGLVDGIRTDSATGSLKITSAASNVLVHKWRSEEAAIMVGKNTALLDDPSLTTRLYKGRNPIRILLDSNGETPKTSNIFNAEAETIVFSDRSKTLQTILSELYERDIQSVLVEGGPTLHRSFYEAGLWDEIRRFVSPLKIKTGVSALTVSETAAYTDQIEKDQLYVYRNR